VFLSDKYCLSTNIHFSSTNQNSTIMKKCYLNSFLFVFLMACMSVGQAAPKENGDEGWTVINQWTVNPSASGLAYDGEFFYIGSYGGGFGANMYKFDPQTGVNELLFAGPQSASYGLTFDGTHLWTIDRVSPISTPAYALQLDMQGNAVSQFDLTHFYMSGIAWDDGNFWVATYNPNPGQITHVDGQGNVLSSFVPPSNQPWDLALQGDSIWIIDYWNFNIHLVLTDGTLVESFPYPDHRASGIYHDGTHLWYIGRESNGVSTLYQVDPWGTGTPEINAPFSHNFSNVTVGETAHWNMNIFNDGTGELVISDIVFSDPDGAFSLDATFPITIEANAFETLVVSFSPDEVAIYEEYLTIYNNDPANLQVEVLLAGNGLFDGAYLETVQELIDFGEVRTGSTSRLFLEVKNMGNTNLVFESIDFDHDYFYWDESVEFPVSLNPVQERSLPFWFFPASAGVVNAEMELVFNNPEQSPYTIYVKGFSEEQDYLLGVPLWEHQFTGSYDFHAKAIMAVPDITGDGVDDLVISTRDNRIRMFNGNSSGNPDILWDIQLGTVEYPKAIALLDDINGDGYHDFVVGTAWGDRAITAISSKTGEVIWRYQTNQYGNGGWVHMLDVKYDFNGNGYLDVLAATGDDGDGTGPRRVFLFNGKNGEIIWEAPLNSSVYSVLAVEDFTGDGIPDVIAGATSPAQQGKVFGINGSNGNVVWEITTSGTSVWALEQLNDITGNGVKDVIAGSFNGFYYLLDATDGDIVFSGSLGSVLILDFWLAGDLNNDGFVDVFSANSSIPNAVAISGQNGQIIWSTPVADQPWSIAPLRDITGDGIHDVAVGTLFQNNFVYFLNGADGSEMKAIPMPAAVDAIAAIPDITGDNSMEVVAGSRNGYTVALSGGIEVAPQQFEVTFHVMDGADPANDIEDATIVITQTGQSFQTDAQGMAVLQMVNGTYEFTVSREGFFDFQNTFTVEGENLLVEVVLSVDDTSVPDLDDPRLVNTYSYPNPLRDQAGIVFTLTRQTTASVIFCDITGKVVNMIEERHYPAGENTITWDGRDQNGALLPDGMYFYEVVTPGQAFKNRIMILRN
jgi:outer membrane protein assembly factor BamB